MSQPGLAPSPPGPAGPGLVPEAGSAVAPGASAATREPFDAELVQEAGGLLRTFNHAGVLGSADVHVALRLAKLAGEGDDLVALAAALAVRAPRYGHVHVDLARVRHTAAADADDVDFDALPWPDLAEWTEAVSRSPLVAVGDGSPEERPLRLVGTALYLDRYWRDEGAVATDLRARAATACPDVDQAVLADGLRRLFPDPRAAEPRWAAAAAVLGTLSVIAGGPGTGKTTAVARVVALLYEQALAAGRPLPLVALAAPTGKAAARLQEAVHGQAGRLDVSGAVREQLLAVGASTIHRLLGRRPDNASRFRHHRHNRLPHDVVVIDETSMVPLSLMARLTEAVRPDSRLVLVGDPEQLASVEAGAVMGDIVGPALGGLRMRPAASAALARVTGTSLAVARARPETAIGDGVVVLRSSHRFGGALAELAAAIRAGDADRVVAVLSSDQAGLRWLPVDVATAQPSALAPARQAVVDHGAGLVEAAAAGDGPRALAALARFRLLCAHRSGPAGASTWASRAEGWLAAAVENFVPDGSWYVGRPVIVTANDYGLRLFNGDTGVAVARPQGGIGVAFAVGGSVKIVSPARLPAVETVFAMTVHKAQGSELEDVAILLPGPGSRVLTRELLYTAVTRARRRVLLAGTEESIRAAVDRPISRASALIPRLWGPEPAGAGDLRNLQPQLHSPGPATISP